VASDYISPQDHLLVISSSKGTISSIEPNMKKIPDASQSALLILLAFVAALASVEAVTLYQLEVLQVKAPAGALDEIESQALSFLWEIFEYAPQLEALGPGEICPEDLIDDDDYQFPDNETYNDRDLEVASTDVADSENQEQRVLDLENCPAVCQNSGRPRCRVLGCAFCGRECGERRNLLESGDGSVTPTQATYIEVAVNRKLKPYCYGITDCRIKCRFFRLNSDGTLTRVRYEIL
jgi:hypothetical protein